MTKEHSEVLQRFKKTRVSPGGVDDAVWLQGKQSLNVVRSGDAEIFVKPRQSTSVFTDLVGIRNKAANKFKGGVGINSGNGVNANIPGTPLHNSIRHYGSFRFLV